MPKKVEPFHRVVVMPNRVSVKPYPTDAKSVAAALKESLSGDSIPQEYKTLAPKVERYTALLGLDLSNGVQIGDITTLTLAEICEVKHENLLRHMRKVFANQGWASPIAIPYKDSTGRTQNAYVMDDIKATAVASSVDKELLPILALTLKFFQAAYYQVASHNRDLQLELLKAKEDFLRLKNKELSLIADERADRLALHEENMRDFLHFVQRASWQASSLVPPVIKGDIQRWLFIHLTLATHGLSYMTIRENHFRRAYLHLIEDIPEDKRIALDASYLTPNEVAELKLSAPRREDTIDEQEALVFDQDMSDPQKWVVPPMPEGLPANFSFADLWAMVDPITNVNHPLRRKIRDNPDLPDLPE